MASLSQTRDTANHLRRTQNYVPLLAQQLRAQADAQKLGLQVGAVDTITHPIRPGILLSRVQAHLVAGMASRSRYRHA